MLTPFSSINQFCFLMNVVMHFAFSLFFMGDERIWSLHLNYYLRHIHLCPPNQEADIHLSINWIKRSGPLYMIWKKKLGSESWDEPDEVWSSWSTSDIEPETSRFTTNRGFHCWIPSHMFVCFIGQVIIRKHGSAAVPNMKYLSMFASLQLSFHECTF